MNKYAILPLMVFVLSGVIVNNLCTTSQQIDNGITFSTEGGQYNCWVAYDFNPDSGYTITDVSGQWIYNLGPSAVGDMNFAIYKSDLNSLPIYTFTIPLEDYVEYDTGINVFGRDVFQADIALGANEFPVQGGILYWIAMQMDSEDKVFFIFREDSIIDDVIWWYSYDGVWESSYDFFGGTAAEGSYAVYGEVTGIESASLGEIKALFR